MEKGSEYNIPHQENKIKPESPINRVKNTISNIFHRGQKPERGNDKPVSGMEKEAFVNEFMTKILNKAKSFGLSKDEFSSLSKLSHVDPELSMPEREEKKRFQVELEKKAKEKNVPVEKLKRLTDFDLETIEDLNLQKINRGEFEFYKNDLNDHLRSIDSDDNLASFTEFVKKHKGAISIAEIATYLSAFGVPALKAFTGENLEVVIHGEKIPLLNLSKNPNLLKEIDDFYNGNSPIDILKFYDKEKALKYNNTSLKLGTTVDIDMENKVHKFVYGEIKGDITLHNKLSSDLKKFNLQLELVNGGVPLEKFIENKDRIIETISRDLIIPKEAVSNYTNQYLMPDTSRISVVPLNEFKINKDLNFSKDSLDLNNKIDELYKKYQVYEYSESGKVKGVNKTNNLKAWNEFEMWGREKGFINDTVSADDALYNERKKNKDTPIGRFEELKEFKEQFEFNNDKNFEKLFLKDIEESGETVEHLKEIAKDNPEEVIKIISKILGKNITYDYGELQNISKNDSKAMDEKHEHGIPFITLETHLGVCHDYATTFQAAKYVLEKQGVPNMDKFAVLITNSNEMNHAWNNLLTVDKDGNLKMTSIDSTWADDENISKIPEKLNAVDDFHYYTSITYEVNKSHQEALKKILEFNALAEEEKLRQILTTYDPKLHRDEQAIQT